MDPAPMLRSFTHFDIVHLKMIPARPGKIGLTNTSLCGQSGMSADVGLAVSSTKLLQVQGWWHVGIDINVV